MAEEKAPPIEEITENDKLMAAISYPIPLLAIVILLVEDMRSRPFQKFHAVQSLAVGIVLGVIILLLFCLLGTGLVLVLSGIAPRMGIFLSCVGILPLALWLVTFYWAYLAYQGQYFDIPVVTDFIKGQGWV